MFRLQVDSPEQAEKQVLDCLSTALQGLRDEYPRSRTAGVGFPGFFHGDSGILAASPNIPQLCEFNLAAGLAEQLDMAVCVQNDALLAATGEFHFGVGRGLEQLMHITLGTGIGSGVIIHGHAYCGDGGMAMEIGHLRVEPPDSKASRLCGCGNSGCLEAYASANAVFARYSEAADRPEAENAEQVYALAKAGDSIARQILEDAGHRLGRALAEAAKLLDIHNISISGGLAAAWDILHPALYGSLERELIPSLRGNIQVHQSTLGDNAGLLGAAVFARKQAA